MARQRKQEERRRLPENVGQTIKRILNYVGKYKIHLILVVIFVFVSAIANIVGTYFLKPLINDFILPLVGGENPDFSELIAALTKMGIFYLIGALSTYLYNRLMIEVSTGTLYKLRIDLFKHMQTLPINFFDTHTHGELMSRFTNDIDAFRNMLSQSFVQLINSAITIIGVFFVMLALSPLLTLLVIIMLIVMFFTVAVIGKGSRKFFMAQQSALGDMNGYIEEMMEGQKVVKVFNYEERARKTFDDKNENLFENSRGAQALASMLRPIMGNLSYVLYAVDRKSVV